MKALSRIVLSLLCFVAFCLLFSPTAYTEQLVMSEMKLLGAHGVYVNEENFPDEAFRQYLFDKFGAYVSSTELATTTVIDCSHSYYISSEYEFEDINDDLNEDMEQTHIIETVEIAINPGDSDTIPVIQEEREEEKIPGDSLPDDNSISEAFTFGASENDHSRNGYIYRDELAMLIKSLKGIELFSGLKELYCDGNEILDIDLSKNTSLEIISCSANNLLHLNLDSTTALRSLNCSYNQLDELDLSKHTALRSLMCEGNILDELDLSNNTALTELNCSENKLRELNLDHNTALTSLYCNDNLLIKLDLSKNIFLSSIQCRNNCIMELTLDNNDRLNSLDCSDNQINYLNIENCQNLMNLCAEEEPTIYDNKLCYAYHPFYPYGGSKEMYVDATVKLIPVNCFAISERYFPDVNLRNCVSDTFDTDGDSCLCAEEIEATIEFDCSGKEIHNLKGLEFLKNLRRLNCSNNSIDYLSVGYSLCLLELINSVESVIDQDHVIYRSDDAYLIYDSNVVLTDLACPQNLVNKINFPDAAFRAYVSEKIDTDSNNYLSDDEIASVTWIDCSGNGEERGDIQSVQGIELFPSLELLDCSYNHIRTLDISNNSRLKKLDCSTNNLQGYIDLTSNSLLENVYCYNNQLEDIDLGTNNNLVELWCNNNYLSALDISGLTAIRVLWCDTNQLTDINTTNNAVLETLNCANNKLDNLDLSQNHILSTLWCYSNRLSELNLLNNPDMKKLGCYENFIADLDISCCIKLLELVTNSSDSQRNGVVYYFDESNDDPVYLQYDIGVKVTTARPVPDLILPASLTIIDSEAFAGGAFTYVLVPANVAEIGPRAFADCPNLRYVALENQATRIDPTAFEGVTGLTIIDASDNQA